MPVTLTRQLNLLTYNVKDFGAVGNGTTDDTVAIAAAYSAASGASYGGEIFFPPGTFMTNLIAMAAHVSIRGSGRTISTLMLNNSQNTDLLQGTYQGYTNGQHGYSGTSQMTNIGTPSAQGNTGGMTDFTISDITLDGNRSHQASGTGMCLNFYGYGFTLINMNIRNAYGNGMLVDWNGGSSLGFQGSTTNSQPFAFMTDVKCHNNGGIGCVWGGPHDSAWNGFYSFFNDSHSYQIGTHSPGILANNCHGFGPTTQTGSVNFLVESGFNEFTGCCAEGSDICQVVMLGNTNIWAGGHIYLISGFAGSGIQLGQIASATLKSAAVASPITLTSALTTVAPSVFFQFVVSGASGFNGTIAISGTNFAGGAVSENITVTTNATYTSVNSYAALTSITVATITGYSINVIGLGVPYSGSTNASAGVTTAVAAAANVFDTMITRCEGVNGAFWFANDAGNNRIACNCSLNAGAYATGTPNVLTQYEFTPQNVISPTGTLATGGGKQLSIKATNAFRMSDRTNDLFNINTFSKQLQLPNGMNIITYSDNYTTKKHSVDQFGNIFQAGNTTYVPSSVATPSTGGTITTSGIPIARVNPSANITGVIMQAGSNGQEVTVENQSAFCVVFDVAGTSHVADGASDFVPATSARGYIYDGGTALWYPKTPPLQPPLILTSEILVAGGGSAIMTANAVYCYEYVLQVPVTVTNMRWMTGVTATGNVDAGIYDSGGNLLTHTGTVVNTSASTCTNVALSGGNYILVPGKYYLAFTPGNGTDTFERVSALIAAGSPMIPIFTAVNASTGTTSPVLPNTTGGVALVTKCPFFAAAISGGI